MIKLSALLAAAGLALVLAALLPGPQASGAAAADGRAIFAGKGCAVCHRHAEVAGSGKFGDAYSADGPPDLTMRPLDAAFLRRWLKDPAAVRPETSMPNLNLSETEIDALVAFLIRDEGSSK